ncbi:tubulin binding cofactor A [Pleurotus eryngii]|uniref:Tubulin-specific chaperone A n=1 Tax=Pleurotus eryngii TaxID=5323 RepID=A0A9P6DCZ9_PLEER|nr:tubulin binding cofactor A [Pleurotus eryngii]
MSDVPTIRRSLKIKTGSANRLLKEHNLYRKEAEAQQLKLDKFKADENSEAWDINNGTRMMEEANKMIADSDARLGKAVADLRELVIAAKKIPELTEAEELLKAEEALESTGI